MTIPAHMAKLAALEAVLSGLEVCSLLGSDLRRVIDSTSILLLKRVDLCLEIVHRDDQSIDIHRSRGQ
jgi:hypothetical protein